MYYISPNNEYPRHMGDIQIEHPSWNLGDPLPSGWIQVEDAPIPTATASELVYEDFPVEKNGAFVRNWKIRPLTAEEIAVRNAPNTAKQKLLDLGLTEAEIRAITKGLVL